MKIRCFRRAEETCCWRTWAINHQDSTSVWLGRRCKWRFSSHRFSPRSVFDRLPRRSSPSHPWKQWKWNSSMINVWQNPIIVDSSMGFEKSFERKVNGKEVSSQPLHWCFLLTGLRGTYQGLTATMLKQGSNQAIRFYVVETLKERYRFVSNASTCWKPSCVPRKYNNKGPNAAVPVLVTGVFGLVAGAASVFGNTPLDVVKTRMQSLEAAKYKNTLDCAVQIMRNEGPLA